MKVFIVLLSMAALACCSLQACKRKDEEAAVTAEETPPGMRETKVLVRGTVDQTFAGDEIVATPLSGGVAQVNAADITVGAIQEDGSFQLELPRTHYVFILRDKNAKQGTPSARLDGLKAVLGFTLGRESVIVWPLREARTEIALPRFQTPNDDNYALSVLSVSEAAHLFALDPQRLWLDAKSDDLLGHLKNQLANFDAASGRFYHSTLIHNMRAFNKNAVDSSLKPEDFVAQGFALDWRTNDATVDVEGVCRPNASEGLITLAVVPPAGAVVQRGEGTTQYKESYPMTNLGLTPFQIDADGCRTDVLVLKGTGEPGLHLTAGGNGFYLPLRMPSGRWRLKANGEEVAAFDLVLASPVGVDDKPTVFIPVTKLEKDANGFVTKARVTFFVYDRNAETFAAITDLRSLEDKILDVTLTLNDYTGTTAEPGRRVSSLVRAPERRGAEFVWTFEPVFKVPGSSGVEDPVAEGVMVSYHVAGMTLRFELRTDAGQAGP